MNDSFVELPKEFISLLKESVGEENSEIVKKGLDATEVKTSIRFNHKSSQKLSGEYTLSPITWADEAYYISPRPRFRDEPGFQTGAYYVQESSSMGIEPAIKQLIASSSFKAIKESANRNYRMLDLCAAPGGKSTHVLSLFKAIESCYLVSNEVIRNRSSILAENISKWGSSNVIVTNNDPKDFNRLGNFFDLILADVPCSGEGMFKKDMKARQEWSLDNVKHCQSRQHRIIADIWPSLKKDGIMIYSTCTFNHYEDDDNIKWICETLGAEVVSVEYYDKDISTNNSTKVVKTEMGGYKFLPGLVDGEGFFFAMLRKTSEAPREEKIKTSKKGKVILPGNMSFLPSSFNIKGIKDGYKLFQKNNFVKAYPIDEYEEMLFVESRLKSIHSGVVIGTLKRDILVYDADFALSETIDSASFSSYDASTEEIDKYLSKQSLVLSKSAEEKEYPKGYILIKYQNSPVGFVKNLGNRTNNLWKIRR
ncbi:MAG: rRNA cytosine-C5-methyltransferase [Bacteroidales bacterium]